jgi:hypothetical protein
VDCHPAESTHHDATFGRRELIIRYKASVCGTVVEVPKGHSNVEPMRPSS